MKNNLILISGYCENIQGEIEVLGDKSISHRAVILSSLAMGESRIEGLLESEDVLNTIKAFKQLGVIFKKEPLVSPSNLLLFLDDSPYNKKFYSYVVSSPGFHNFKSLIHIDETLKKNEFYMGNSGTSCRLLAGVFAGLYCNDDLIFTGDASLSKRPMIRVVEPLKLMGADIKALGYNNTLPLYIAGKPLNAIIYELKIASAQVKSAIMLAALFAKGKTTIVENWPTRDHTENMLLGLGVNIKCSYITINNQKGKQITVDNQQKLLKPGQYHIPGDFSGAAFFIGLALITKKSALLIKGVNLNPLRTGLLEVLTAMGADLKILNQTSKNNEATGDILIQSSVLKGVNISPYTLVKMIDEFPILAVIATLAEGKTNFNGIQELRYKESDRVNAMVFNLRKLGVQIEEAKDRVTIFGENKLKLGGVEINSFADHRIAMAFLIMGAVCKNPIKVDYCESLATSFPNFKEICSKLGHNLLSV
ncbi:3-phosphoshikimate 1-carboxyvinyltransferase [Candidatus Hepatincolaceae symbiont of Richtersius coronifer]